MFNGKRLGELEETQRLLTAQADLHRGIIRLEMLTVRDRLKWFRGAGGLFQHPLFLGAAALTGGVAVSKWRRLTRWIPAAFSAWRFLRPFFSRRWSMAPGNGLAGEQSWSETVLLCLGGRLIIHPTFAERKS